MKASSDQAIRKVRCFMTVCTLVSVMTCGNRCLSREKDQEIYKKTMFQDQK